MSDRIIIQCPGCSAKLAISDAGKLGKKIKCSKCAEVFVAKAMSSGSAEAGQLTKPARKPKKSDEDEFNFDDMELEDSAASEEEESAAEAPARSSRLSGKKSVASKGKGKGKGRKPSGGNLPVIIGGAVAVVLLLGGGVWLLMGGRNEPALAPAGEQPVAQTTATPAADPAAAAAIPGSTTTPLSPSGSAAVNDPGSGPRFPDGISEPPQWLIANAPFDVAKFFEAPPPDQNAAPLYLEAIFEFSAEPANLFPAGPQTEQRRQAAVDRAKRHASLFTQNIATFSAEQIDAMLLEHETGFQKLSLAQQRPQCVFQSGLGVFSLLPHVQSARQVVRVAAARTFRDLQNGNFDRAIQSIEMCLRLSRDLTHRGVMNSQLVSIALEHLVYDDMLRRLLSTPGIQREHCDRLFAILKQHERESRDMFVEGLQAEYIMQRIMLHEIQTETGALSAESRRALMTGKDNSMVAVLMAYAGVHSKTEAEIQRFKSAIENLDERREIVSFDEFYRASLSLAEKPYRDRTPAAHKIVEEHQQKSVILGRILAPSVSQFLEVRTRNLTRRHGAQAVVALRRWQLNHTESPRDLAQVMSDAGVNAVPVDQFADAPLKLAKVRGEWVVYSIGPDDKDDGGQVEWNLQPGQPGDIVFRMTPPPITPPR